MTGKQKLCVVLAGCHLALVAYFGFSLPAPGADTAAGAALHWYGGMTGANNSYGFFKYIQGTCRAKFQLEAADGRVWNDVLKRVDNPEAEMRFRLPVFQFGDFGETIAKHWAATMLARHPDAVKVTVVIEQYDPPDMAAYRAGERAEWRLLYEQFFWKTETVYPAKKGATP